MLSAPTSRLHSIASILSVLLTALVLYVNLLCVTGFGAVCQCPGCEGMSRCCLADSCGPNAARADAPSRHQQTSDRQNGNHSHDVCFCVAVNTAVVQETIKRPTQSLSLRSLDVSSIPVLIVTPLGARAAYEHAPPAVALPFQLASKIISPRAPPHVA